MTNLGELQLLSFRREGAEWMSLGTQVSIVACVAYGEKYEMKGRRVRLPMAQVCDVLAV